MHAVQNAARLGCKVIKKASEFATEERVLVIRLTNGTHQVLKVPEEPFSKAGTCHLSFTELQPGEVGTIRCTSAEGSGVASVAAGAHHATVIPLLVGEETVLLVEKSPFGQTRRKNSRFQFRFLNREDPDYEAPLSRHLKKLPREFMGSGDGSHNTAKGREFWAKAMANSQREVDMVILREDVDIVESWDCIRQLDFAELCRDKNPKSLVAMLFLLDSLSLVNCLNNISLSDRAYALDLMIVSFIKKDGILGVAQEGLKLNLGKWESSRAALLPHGAASGEGPRTLNYKFYSSLDQEDPALAHHAEASLLLIRATIFQCVAFIHEAANVLRDQGLWKCEKRKTRRRSRRFSGRSRSPSGSSASSSASSSSEESSGASSSASSFEPVRSSKSSRRQGSAATATPPEQSRNALALIEHLTKRSTSDDDEVSSAESSGRTSSSSSSCSSSSASSEGRTKKAGGSLASFLACGCGSGACGSGGATAPRKHGDLSGSDLLIALVMDCLTHAAELVRRRARLYQFVAASVLPGVAGQELLHYSQVLPTVVRSWNSRGQKLPMAACKGFSLDSLASLDGGEIVGPEQLLKAFGPQAPKCKVMSTNSKSGEFFFMSSDMRFCIKTISEHESVLMQKMFPAMNNHIRDWPQSLIVRFAGLYHLDVPSAGLNRYFVVMRSVFDSEREVHETFDLKGSIHNRKKKEGEKIGKDEDWINAKHTINLSEKANRDLLAMHELDAQLLKSFDVMDYSLLVGLHHLSDEEKGSFTKSRSVPKPGSAMVSEDGKVLYYAALIDFLIGYDLHKEAETLIRVIQGVGDKASCVSPEAYAKRQAHFLRDAVIAPCRDSAGQLGRLKIEVDDAKDLIAGDWTGSSDPYVVASLGLLSSRTATIARDRNPSWNEIIYLPVNEAHRGTCLDLEVWDEDAEALGGSDDFLGRVSIPVGKILEQHEKNPASAVRLDRCTLTSVASGTLSATISFEAC